MKKDERKMEMEGGGLNPDSIKEILEFYKEENEVIHIVLKGKRFYNGKIIELRETLLIFNDNKLEKVSIPLRDIYFIERFNDPQKG